MQQHEPGGTVLERANLFGHLRVDRLVGRRHAERAEPEQEQHGGRREKGNARGRPLEHGELTGLLGEMLRGVGRGRLLGQRVGRLTTPFQTRVAAPAPSVTTSCAVRMARTLWAYENAPPGW